MKKSYARLAGDIALGNPRHGFLSGRMAMLVIAAVAAFGMGNARAESPEGSPENPWLIGAEGREDEVKAWTNGVGGLVIGGSGAMRNFTSDERSPWGVDGEICDSITACTIAVGVTSIGAHAFEDCLNLNSVTIPSSVTSIGAYAFSGCGISYLTVPSSVRKLGEHFFNSGILRLECPMCDFFDESGEVIRFDKAGEPHWLSNVLDAYDTYVICADEVAADWGLAIRCGEFNRNDYTWNVDGWEITGTIEGGRVNARYLCCNRPMEWDGTETLTVPDAVGPFPIARVETVEVGGDYANIVFPASVSYIFYPSFCCANSTVTFMGCVPDGFTECLQEIGDSEMIVRYPEAFADEWRLFVDEDGRVRSTERPHVDDGNIRYWLSWSRGGWSIVEIGFVPDLEDEPPCPETLTLPTTLTFLGHAVRRVGGEYGILESFHGSLSEVVIPEGYENIGNCAFESLSELQSVTIASSVTNIGAYAFAWCYNLKSVTIPEGVTSIGAYAFAWCYNLKSVTIPEGVTSIGAYAFADCSNLESVTIPSSVTNIGALAFEGCGISYLTVPSSVRELGAGFYYNGILRLECPMCDFIDESGNVIRFDKAKEPGWLRSVLAAEYVYVICADEVAADWEKPILCGGFNDPGQEYNWSVDGWDVRGYVEDGVVWADSVHCNWQQMAWDGTETLTLPDAIGPLPVGAVGEITFLKGPLERIVFPASVKAIYNFWNVIYSLKTIEFLGGVPDGFTAYLSGLNEKEIVVLYPEEFADDWKLFVGDDGKVKSGDRPYADVGDIRYWLSWRDGGWSIDSVSSVPDQEDDPQYHEVLTLPSSVLGRPVTGIEAYAFDASDGCAVHFESVVIPSSVTSIGAYAFADCYNLESVVIPSSVTSIGAYAFADCYNLESVVIPSSVTSIGEGTFLNCGNLMSVVIPEGVTSIGAYAFEGCSNLDSVVIPSSVTSIGSAAFLCALRSFVVDPLNEAYSSPSGLLCSKDCTTLIAGVNNRVVTIPSSVTSIEEFAFDGCWNLMSVVIPEGVTSIGAYAFGSCSDLNSVVIPKSVTIVEGCAFAGCERLRAVCFCGDKPEGCKDIYYYSGDSVTTYVRKGSNGWDEVPGEWCGRPIELWENYPDGFGCVMRTEIGGRTWLYCVADDGVEILGCDDAFGELVVPAELGGHRVTAIGAELFEGLSMSSLVLSEGIEQIGRDAFRNCFELRSVVIPGSVTHIGDFAFGDCPALQAVCFCGDMPEVGESFYWNDDVETYVREGTSGWDEVPGEWQGRPIKWWTSYPEIPGPYEPGPYEQDIRVVSYGGYDWTVRVEEDGVWIGNYSTAVDPLPQGRLEIPAELVGMPVVGVNPYAFAECDQLTEVALPKSLAYLDANAFWAFGYYYDMTIAGALSAITVDKENPYYEMRDGFLIDKNRHALVLALGKVGSCVIPDDIAEIDGVAFVLCLGLTELTIPDGIEHFDGSMVRGCTSLVSIKVSEKNPFFKSENGLLLDKSGETLVAGPEGIVDVVVPDGVKTIGDQAFIEAKMKSVTIPASVEQIPWDAFSGCSSLTDIRVDPGNAHYSAKNGLLLTADGTRVIFCARGVLDANVPEGVTQLADGAFQSHWWLKSVTLPVTLERIGANAFWGCAELKSVTIPAGVTSIGSAAFAYCYDLTAVCFEGNAPEVDEGSPDDWYNVGFYGWSEQVTTYVREGTSGWGEVPGEWQGRPIEWWTSYPEIPDPHEPDPYEQDIRVVSYGGYDWPVIVEEDGVWIGAYTGAINPLPQGRLEIPAELLGMPVIGVNVGYAFMGCDQLTEVVLPKSLAYINVFDEAVFSGSLCSLSEVTVDEENPYYEMRDGFLIDKRRHALVLALGKVGSCVVPEDIEEIGYMAFVFCPELTELTIPDGIWDINDGTVRGCTSLVSIKVSENHPFFKSENGLLLDESGETLVACPEGIVDVVVPDGVKTIVNSAFGEAKMKSVRIPASVEQMNGYTFSRCPSLTDIRVDPGNALYSAQNGLLLTVDGTQVISCAHGVLDVNVPEGVTQLADNAFTGHFWLKSATLPATLKCIGANAFWACIELKSVTIPAGVTSIGSAAFASCSTLTTVCFEGNAPEVDEGSPDDWWTEGFYGWSEQVTTYVREGTSGWGEVPGTWQGRPIAFWVEDGSTLIPEIPDDAGVEEIEEALVETTDEKVLENIYQTVEEEGEEAAVELYNAYRDWAGKVKGEDDKPAGLQAVCDSPAAWTSFALDSPKLLEKNPTDADLTVEEFKPSEESGTFDFIVSIKDVEVGSAAAAVNLKRTFGLEGATDLSSSKFDEANVDIVFGQPVDGNLKFTAEPKDKGAKSFFMKMRVR